ncbi:hypothetical protein IE53DRAFT_390871 [Violaceomyces palustris]|uniref:Uncharacterized protein n=1 Tax=Violaceomyces palustris TaxID=1673888 RepID=A0ACD0NMJ6_9BASI|nr:hypothetical protein IE53DRAFT_390871 [Violaceomyces palustris]
MAQPTATASSSSSSSSSSRRRRSHHRLLPSSSPLVVLSEPEDPPAAAKIRQRSKRHSAAAPTRSTIPTRTTSLRSESLPPGSLAVWYKPRPRLSHHASLPSRRLESQNVVTPPTSSPGQGCNCCSPAGQSSVANGSSSRPSSFGASLISTASSNLTSHTHSPNASSLSFPPSSPSPSSSSSSASASASSTSTSSSQAVARQPNSSAGSSSSPHYRGTNRSLLLSVRPMPPVKERSQTPDPDELLLLSSSDQGQDRRERVNRERKARAQALQSPGHHHHPPSTQTSKGQALSESAGHAEKSERREDRGEEHGEANTGREEEEEEEDDDDSSWPSTPSTTPLEYYFNSATTAVAALESIDGQGSPHVRKSTEIRISPNPDGGKAASPRAKTSDSSFPGGGASNTKPPTTTTPFDLRRLGLAHSSRSRRPQSSAELSGSLGSSTSSLATTINGRKGSSDDHRHHHDEWEKPDALATACSSTRNSVEVPSRRVSFADRNGGSAFQSGVGADERTGASPYQKGGGGVKGGGGGVGIAHASMPSLPWRSNDKPFPESSLSSSSSPIARLDSRRLGPHHPQHGSPRSPMKDEDRAPYPQRSDIFDWVSVSMSDLPSSSSSSAHILTRQNLRKGLCIDLESEVENAGRGWTKTAESRSTTGDGPTRFKRYFARHGGGRGGEGSSSAFSSLTTRSSCQATPILGSARSPSEAKAPSKLTKPRPPLRTVAALCKPSLNVASLGAMGRALELFGGGAQILDAPPARRRIHDPALQVDGDDHNDEDDDAYQRGVEFELQVLGRKKSEARVMSQRRTAGSSSRGLSAKAWRSTSSLVSSSRPGPPVRSLSSSGGELNLTSLVPAGPKERSSSTTYTGGEREEGYWKRRLKSSKSSSDVQLVSGGESREEREGDEEGEARRHYSEITLSSVRSQGAEERGEVGSPCFEPWNATLSESGEVELRKGEGDGGGSARVTHRVFQGARTADEDREAIVIQPLGGSEEALSGGGRGGDGGVVSLYDLGQKPTTMSPTMTTTTASRFRRPMKSTKFCSVGMRACDGREWRWRRTTATNTASTDHGQQRKGRVGMGALELFTREADQEVRLALFSLAPDAEMLLLGQQRRQRRRSSRWRGGEEEHEEMERELRKLLLRFGSGGGEEQEPEQERDVGDKDVAQQPSLVGTLSVYRDCYDPDLTASSLLAILARADGWLA